MGPRPWERASRPIVPVVKAVVKARANVPVRRHVPARQPAAAAWQHDKIPGTKIKMLKGGTSVRVVQASGREFAVNDVQGCRSHVQKLARTGQASPVQGQPTKWGGSGYQQVQGKGQAANKIKPVMGSGKFASNFKAQKLQLNTPSAASGLLKFTPPQLGGKGSGAKFTLRPTAKVASTSVRKKIIKTVTKSGKPFLDTRASKNDDRSRQPRPMLNTKQAGRALVNNTYFTGKVVQCGSSHAWALPLRPSIPAHVRTALKQMNDDNRAANKADNNWSSSWQPFAGGTKEHVVYLALADIKEKGLTLRDGLSVRFKLYTDAKGVGGCEIVSSQQS